MKKYLYLLFYLFLFIFSESKAQLSYGLKVGSTFSSFAQANNSLSGALGVIGGGMVDYGLTHQVTIHGNIDYLQLRGALEGIPQNVDGAFVLRTSIYTMHAAEAAGLVSYRVPLPVLFSASPAFMAGGGVTYNFFVQDKRTTKYYYQDHTATSRGVEDVTSSFTPLLYSVQAGLRFEFPLEEDSSLSTVVFDVRFRRNINELLSGFSIYGNGNASDLYLNTVIFAIGFKL